MNHTAAAPYPTSAHDSDYDMSDNESDQTKPWLAEFESYLMTHDIVLEGMLIVEWWGIYINLFIYDSSLYSYHLVV